MVSHLPHSVSPGNPKACSRVRTHLLPLEGRCDKDFLGVFYPFTAYLPCSDAVLKPVITFFNPPTSLFVKAGYPFCRGNLKHRAVR